MPETLAPVLTAHADALVQWVLQRACERKLRLVTAESCTGGLLASLLTDVTGASHAFDRGFVTYSNAAKHEQLGVPLALLDDPGPVSEAVARAMAEGAIRHSLGDLAISVTGYAGPGLGATPGLVHLAVALRGGATVHRRRQFVESGRAEVRLKAIGTALDMLREQLI